MSGAATHSLGQYIQLGRLGDALKRLNDGSDCGIVGIDRDLVASEVSALAGFSSDAKRLAERVVSLKDASIEQRLRARIVLAQVRIDAGRAREAHQNLTEIVNDAAAAKVWRLRCWAELWSLTALGDFGSAGEIRSCLRHLRQHVNQLGDPATSIALHLFVAEAESRRGVIASSVQHVRIARTLLQTFPNYWLEALAAIDALCLSVMGSDQEAAMIEEKVALRAAYEAGAEKAKLAVISNSGTLAVVAGNLEVAEKQFKAALRLSKVAPRWRSSILDGLCQVDLARGDFEAAHNRLECLADTEADALSYQVLWPRLTQVRLSLAKNQLTEALRQAEAALIDAERVGDQELTMRLRLLHAEACGRAGDILAAGRSLQAAALGHKDPSLELLADYYRVSSQLLVADGDQTAAGSGFERGRRILLGIGHTRAASDLPTLAVPEAPVAHPATERSDVTTARAAALFNQAARADLLGNELTALLFRVGAAHAVACVAITADGTPHLIAARGWNDAEALAAIAVTPPLPRLELGSWRERHWSLIVDVPPTVTARTAFVAVRTLADCSRTVETSRRQEREKSALWPMDPVEDATHGVFASEAMLDLIRTIRRVAQTPVTILLTGETGTGKDILARLIHEYSPRAGKLFVPFSCTAVPREMLDSQLFGHRRGAFTGAQEQSPGVIRATQGGTLFLDEIGELGPEPQVKLLRFLESNEVHPIGEAHPVQVDVRVVAATNRDVESLVKAGMFRDDLYYRLNVVRLKVPPLRERREEIPIIVDHYLTRFGAEFKKGQLTASSDAMEYLLLHRWPGNVRQLANELRRAAAMAEPDAVITPAHLSPDITAARRTLPSAERDLLPSEVIVQLDQPLDAATEHLERAMIQHAMSLASGHVERAAQLLGLSRKGLYLKRQRLGLEPGAAVPVVTTTGAKGALEDECLPD
jgi:DNA-binding NtrC family response regulator